jgi:hypothetical protein
MSGQILQESEHENEAQIAKNLAVAVDAIILPGVCIQLICMYLNS